jgi:hypothetical protein
MDPKIIAVILAASGIIIITLVIIYNSRDGTGGSMGSLTAARLGAESSPTGTPAPSTGTPTPSGGTPAPLTSSAMDQYREALKKYW